MAEGKYNTNLASEFHVLSTLHRLGANATLTIGNKKSIDIVVEHANGTWKTIDVKGLAGKTSWPVDNLSAPAKGHYLVFVCYQEKIGNPEVVPDVWVLPASIVSQRFIYEAPGGRKVVQMSRLRDEGRKYKGAWHLLISPIKVQGRPLSQKASE